MNQARSASSDPGGSAGRWLWVLGAAGVVIGARFREIHLHSGPTPFLDQWDAEGLEILVPWLQGKLSWTAFFGPHNEHIHAWTRLITWLQAAWLGRWDPQLQAMFNAGLQGLFAGVMAGWLRRTLPRWPAMGFTLLVVVVASLPFSWENSTWGFQAHTPLALLFVFLHIRGSFAHTPGSKGWWLAQASGLAALLTYGSMWAAPTAVVLVTVWTAAPGRWRWTAPTLLSVIGVALLWYARSRQDPATTLTLAAHSPREFLADFLLQLGWPAVWPGACVVLWLPSCFLALQIRRRAQAENLDRIILALAVWSAAQAVAFAYGRGGGYIGFVSRYGDLLALGLTANGLALWRILQASRSWRVLPVLALLAAWVVTVTQGLQLISTRGHTEYFHERSALWAQVRREAVSQYLATRDISHLSSDEVRKVLYPNPAVVAQVLDQAGLADLLPVSLRPNASRTRGDFLSAAASALRALWLEWIVGAGVVLLLGFWLGSRTVASPAPSLVLVSDSWQLPALGLVALGAASLVFLWPKPLEFSAKKRRQDLLASPDTIKGLSFRVTSGPATSPDGLIGAATLWPDPLRQQFFGTLVGGPAFTGTVESSNFPIWTPWLVIPYAGFPASSGNGLYLRIEDPSGNTLKEFICPGPNPADIDFWAIDVHEFIGRSGRVVLYDGRADGEGWVAAAPPQGASGPELAETDRQERAAEPTRFGQSSLGLIALAALLLAGFTALFSRRNA